MVIQHKIGHISTYESAGKTMDWLPLQWFETSKRILHKQTKAGLSVSLKFLQENPALAEGDILWDDGKSLLVIEILPCQTLVIQPADLFEMASVCYEIGNKHLPLFYEEGQVLVPFDAPLFRLLAAQGYQVSQAEKKLCRPLKTTVLPHGSKAGETIFSKILKMTTPHE